MSAKIQRYERLYMQLFNLLSGSPTIYSQLATINAVLYNKIPYIFWIGFYFRKQDKLIVGPYQGPLACQELKYPNGACWNVVLTGNNLIIPDVEQFPGHIACDTRSKSEIVIPIYLNEISGVLDIDSDKPDAFDQEDIQGLCKIISLISHELDLL